MAGLGDIGISPFMQGLLMLGNRQALLQAIGAEPVSQTGAGIGQEVALQPATGAALVAPGTADQTWRVYWDGWVAATATWVGDFTTFIGAGGSTIVAGAAGVNWTGFAKRIA